MVARIVVAVVSQLALGATLSSAFVDAPTVREVSPENQREFRSQVWVQAGVSRCPPAADVWIRLPRARPAGELTRVLLEVHDSDGAVTLLAELATTTSKNEDKVVGGVPGHPLRDPDGFHGVVFCLASDSLDTAEVSALYGGVSGADTEQLMFSRLRRWAP